MIILIYNHHQNCHRDMKINPSIWSYLLFKPPTALRIATTPKKTVRNTQR